MRSHTRLASPGVRRDGQVALAAAWFVVSILFTVPAHADGVSEYDVKAAFLFKFAQYVEWPATAFPQVDAPFCIGVLGDDPFGGALDAAVAGGTINNRKLVIKRSNRVEDLKTCQILFISKSEQAQVGPILDSLGNASILTVGEVDGFADRGGIINFFLAGNKVRFEINPEAARRKGLKINSQLLRVAKVVGKE